MRIVCRRAQENSPETCASGPFMKSGDHLLSRCAHYHRPGMLNGRVRNGNGCLHPGKLTGKFLERLALRLQQSISADGCKRRADRSKYQQGSKKRCSLSRLPGRPDPGTGARPSEQRINAAKRLAVSTGQLRPLLALHLRPIDLVVFQEPTSRRNGDLF